MSLRRIAFAFTTAITIATTAVAQTATTPAAKPAAKSARGGTAIVIVAPCVPIELLIGQTIDLFKPTASILIDDKAVGWVKSCTHRSFPVSAGEHTVSAVHPNSLAEVLILFSGPKYNVHSGQKIYFHLKVGQIMELTQITAEQARQIIAALPKS